MILKVGDEIDKIIFVSKWVQNRFFEGLDKKLINKKYLKLKILGRGELKTKIDITAHFTSKQAEEKINIIMDNYKRSIDTV